MRAFYSKVFSMSEDVKPSHISLYMFLLNQNNRSNWSEWFKAPFDLIMQGASIYSNKTYYSALNDLERFGFIKYRKGANKYKAPKIHIIPLEDKEPTPKPEMDEEAMSDFPEISKQLSGLSPIIKDKKKLDETLAGQLKKNHKTIVNGGYKITIQKEEAGKEFSQDVDTIYNFALTYFPDNIKPDTKRKENNWKETIDKLIKIDKVNKRELCRIIQWARQNDFWKKNFLSLNKLRQNNKEDIKYYEVFKTQMDNAPKEEQIKTTNPNLKKL